MIVVTMKNVTPLDVLLTSGDAECSYDVEIAVDHRTHWKGSIAKHDRMDGISDLLLKVGNALNVSDHEPRLVKPAAYRNVLDGSVAEEAADEPWLSHGR
jgi:hypothetical protein